MLIGKWLLGPELDPYTHDQIIPLAARLDGESRFRIPPVSEPIESEASHSLLSENPLSDSTTRIEQPTRQIVWRELERTVEFRRELVLGEFSVC